MKNRILYDEWQRRHIIEYYDETTKGLNPKKSFTIAVFELTKAMRDLKREILKTIKLK